MPPPLLEAVDRGRLAAELLSGVWRDDVSPSHLAVDDVLRRTLAESGSLGLAWRRLSGRADSVAVEARTTWQWQVVRAAAQERAVAQLVRSLNAGGIDPILLKGLAAARHYPMQGARPSGDIDFLVAPDDFARAADVLHEMGYRTVRSGHPWWAILEGDDWSVDLQTGLWPLPNEETARALRSELYFVVEDVPVRVLPAEIEVRSLAVHAVKHAFARPLWLCDLAAAIERGPELQWEAVLDGSRTVHSWIAGAVGVAERLLDLRLPHELSRRCGHAARWVDAPVLKRWGNGARPVITKARVADVLMAQQGRGAAIRGLAVDWPDQLHVVVHRGWPLSRPLARLATVLRAGERGVETLRHVVSADAATGS